MSKNIDLSRLRNQITIKAKAKTADGQGGFTHTYSITATLWARFEKLSIEKKAMLQRFIQEADAKAYIRHNTLAKEGQYVGYGENNYRIVGISYVENKGKVQRDYMALYLRKIEEI